MVDAECGTVDAECGTVDAECGTAGAERGVWRRAQGRWTRSGRAGAERSGWAQSAERQGAGVRVQDRYGRDAECRRVLVNRAGVGQTGHIRCLQNSKLDRISQDRHVHATKSWGLVRVFSVH